MAPAGHLVGILYMLFAARPPAELASKLLYLLVGTKTRGNNADETLAVP